MKRKRLRCPCGEHSRKTTIVSDDLIWCYTNDGANEFVKDESGVWHHNKCYSTAKYRCPGAVVVEDVEERNG